MKLQLEVKIELDFDDIVDFLSTATYGSFWACVDTTEEYEAQKPTFKKEGDCREDLWAKWLMMNENNYILICDIEEDVEDTKLTLAMIKDAWVKVIKNHKGDFPMLEDMDLNDADEILQTACFGEVIFG